MNLRFVSFLTADKLELPGLLYTPPKPTNKVTIWLHGMGDSAVFYKPKLINQLAMAHVEKGIAFFAFNNRGAHNIKGLKVADDTLPEEDRSYQGGSYYELIADAPKDINGALAFLKDQGFQEFYLAGHSSGANKICVYDSVSKNSQFKKYVLAAPGDDTGLFLRSLGVNRYWQTLKQAAKLVSNHQGIATMPKYSGMYPFSAQSTWDILNPDGNYNTFPYYEHTTERLGEKPLFKEYSAITTPTLVIIGENDEYMTTAGGAANALDIFLHHTSAKMIKRHDFELTSYADHSFRGQESEFSKQLVDWLIRG